MTINSFSRTREASRSYSRQADFHELDQSAIEDASVGNTQKIGSVNVDQLKAGFLEPNVQSAITDISNMYAVPINGVVIRTDSLDPRGISMTERITVEGTATGTNVKIYGLDVKVDVGDEAGVITNKIKARLSTISAENKAIRDVEAVAGSANMVDITFIDTNPHQTYLWQGNGITITGVVNVPAQPGYGSWFKIGTQELVQGSITSTLSYWKRVS